MAPGIKEHRSPLQDVWPPKWFFSYADLATLLMTFFIILSTMLTLQIPITMVADKRLLAFAKRESKRLGEISAIAEKEKNILKDLRGLSQEQIEAVINLNKINEFSKEIQDYIKKENLEQFIVLKENKWSVCIIPLASFLFEKGKIALRPSGKYFLDFIAEFLQRYPSLIKIEGYTDNTPIHSVLYRSNWELSVARANSIMRYFMEQYKIPVEYMEAVGFGEFRPAFPNDTAENRLQNRRVVIEIMPRFYSDKLREP